MSELSTLREIRTRAELLLDALDRQSPRISLSLNVDAARVELRQLIPGPQPAVKDRVKASV